VAKISCIAIWALKRMFSFMNWFYMQFRIVHCWIEFIARLGFFPLMNCSVVLIQCTFLGKWSFTYVTCVWPFPLMNSFNVCFQTTSWRESSITKVAFKRFLLFMNCCHMSFQVSFRFRFVVAKWALMWSSFLMNTCYMPC